MKSRQLYFENLLAQNALGGIPAGYNFADKTLYEIFQDLFSGTSYTQINLEPNTGLEFNLASNLQTKYNTLKADTTVSQPINKLGSKSAAVWKTKTIVEVLDEILFPASLPTYTPTTISLTGSLNNPYYEVGTTQSNSLNLSAIKNDAGIYTSLRILRDNVEKDSVSNPEGTQQASQPQGSDYPNPNIPNFRYDLSYTDSFSVNLGDNTWVGEGNYNPGLAKQNSDGTVDSRSFDTRKTTNPQSGENNFDAPSISIEGIYPYYYGYLDTKPTPANIAALVNGYTTNNSSINKVLRPLTPTEEVYFNAPFTGKWLWFAHTGPTKNSWYTQKFAFPENINTGSGLFNVVANQNFTTTNWENISFKVYISSYQTGSTDGNGVPYWFKFN